MKRKMIVWVAKDDRHLFGEPSIYAYQYRPFRSSELNMFFAKKGWTLPLDYFRDILKSSINIDGITWANSPHKVTLTIESKI